ncbi:MAG: hypothetical protein C0471_17910 [Erythrobacter sp.]|nr:hypothetical protein [Erythrobacter sp.]
MLFYAFGLILIVPAALVGYFWRKKTQRWWRVFGGIFLVFLPIYVFMAITTASSVVSRSHVLHSLPPQSDITYFEAGLFLTFVWGPFWSFGALCGYMLRSLMDRPL